MQHHDVEPHFDLVSPKTAFPLYQTFRRVARYTLVRAFGIFIAVLIGVYLTILVANLVVFVFSVWWALGLTSRYSSFWNRLFVALSPISSVPSWVYGLLLVVIFAGQLRILPFPRQVDILAAERGKMASGL